MSKIRAAFDFIERLEQLTSVSEVLDEFQLLLRKFGLTTFVLGDVVNPHQPDFPRVPIFETRWPMEWAQRWVEKDYMMSDPVVLETLRRSSPFFWHDIRPRQHGLQARIMDEGREFQLFDGLSIPIQREGLTPGTVTMAGRNIEASPDERKAIHLAAIYVHAKIEQLHDAQKFKITHPLSEREREVLHWLAAGKSAPVIGDIVGISEHTVRVHIKRAMKKLNATTQVQAVALGLRSGQLVP